MARRKGGFTELLDFASKLPWKVSAAMVPIRFLACHVIALAFAPVPQATTVADLGSVVIHQGIQIGDAMALSSSRYDRNIKNENVYDTAQTKRGNCV
jgi:hypothetical protein